MAEFKLSPHVKLVIDFEVGEEIRIDGYGPAVDGKHTILEFTREFISQSGVMAKITGYGSWLDIGWFTKI